MPNIFIIHLQAVRILSMKGNRLILLIASILLLTISSGLLFYKNLFLLEGPRSGGKVDFEELRYTDLQTNTTALMMRKNLSTESTVLTSEINRIKELMNIVTDVNKNSTELGASLKKIQTYFDKKIKNLEKFQVGLKDLKNSIESLNPTYNELTKNNLKFVVDKKDFYRECVIDALFYVASTSKENEIRLQDDKKILAQILGFATAPNPIILKYSHLIDKILLRGKELDVITDSLKNDSPINSEMIILGKYYKESLDSKAHDGEIFLTMVFGAIVLYLLCLVFIFKKLN